MAILSKILVATTLLSTITTAAPLVPHYYFTVTDVLTKTVWKTIIATDTDWVNDATATFQMTPPAAITSSTSVKAPIVTTTPQEFSLPATTSAAIPTSTSAEISSSTTYGAQISIATTTSVFQLPPIPPVTTTTSVFQPPAPPPVITTTSAFQPPAAPLVITTTTTSPTPTPTTTTPLATQSSGATAQGQAVTGITGSTTANCEGQGNACTGDVTHWDGGSFSLSPPLNPTMLTHPQDSAHAAQLSIQTATWPLHCQYSLWVRSLTPIPTAENQ